MKRIPQAFKTTFFSVNDIWDFEYNLTATTCEACKEFHGTTFHGNQLRPIFVWMEILDVDTIGGPMVNGDGLVHPNCRCRLRRRQVER